MTDGDVRDAIGALVAAFEQYQAATDDRDAAWQRLRDAHHHALASALSAGRSGLEPADLAPANAGSADLERAADRLQRLELAAVHRGWTRTTEREIRDYEHEIRAGVRDLEQLMRMWRRGPLGQRPAPAHLAALELTDYSRGEFVCTVCDRDAWSPGAALTIAGQPDRMVCWICGDEHDAELTAELLAAMASADHLARAASFLGYFDAMTRLLRYLGAEQRALDLEADRDRFQQLVRDIKAAGLGDQAVWLGSGA